MMKYLFLLICSLIITVSFSCAHKREVTDDLIMNGKLEFLIDGETEKQEIIDQLGPAYHSYENGRIIITYWYGEIPSHGGHPKFYHIVLILNEADVLERHSVVRVR